CCDACDHTIDGCGDIDALLRNDECGRDVTGGAEEASGDIGRGGQQHVAVVDALDAIELLERPTQVSSTRGQAGDAHLIAELHAVPGGDDRRNLQWHTGTGGRPL